jgi:hypothetical protein
MRPFALAALALVAAGLAPAAPAQHAVTLDAAVLDAAAARLEALARSLDAPERAVWDALLLRAAAAPAAAREVRVAGVLRTGPGGGCGEAPGAAAQPAGAEAARVAPGPVDGGAGDRVLRRVSEPAFVADLVAGVFQAIVDRSIQQMEAYGELLSGVGAGVGGFAPAGAVRAAPATSAAARGLAARVAALDRPEERAVVEWLLARALDPAARGRAPAPSRSVSVRVALGIDPPEARAVARRPVPAPPPPVRAWTLRC